MPAPTDPATAARRVAAKLAPHRGKDLTGQCLILDGADALALLPVLDAVARGAEGDRVERWARAMCIADGVDPDGRYSLGGAPWWTAYRGRAEQAIALADAEAAGRLAESRGEAGSWLTLEAFSDMDEAEWPPSTSMAARVELQGALQRVIRAREKRRAVLDAAVRGIGGDHG